VINVRKMYPNLPLLVKAKNGDHKRRLETMFGEQITAVHAHVDAVVAECICLAVWRCRGVRMAVYCVVFCCVVLCVGLN
jgi:hypothetical protein